MTMKTLKGKGEADYDFKQDILFFKTKDREYKKSIELDNIVLDIDEEGFIVGIQIFEASKFLNLKKDMLLSIPTWQYQATFYEGRIEVRLMFQIKVRNKIIEKNPIIMQQIQENLPNSELVCTVS